MESRRDSFAVTAFDRNGVVIRLPLRSRPRLLHTIYSRMYFAIYPGDVLRKDLMHTLLAVKNLSVYYRSGASRQHAVEKVSFDIGVGEVVGLMGQSGCGKTSIALALLGLLSKKRADVSGSVQFLGKELLAMDQSALRAIRGAGISMVFQEPEIALNPVMRVRDQVAEVIHAHKDLSWAQCRANAELPRLRPICNRRSRRPPGARIPPSLR